MIEQLISVVEIEHDGEWVEVEIDQPVNTVDVLNVVEPIQVIEIGNLGGPPGAPGEDYDPAEADLRYVNVTGDEMVGTLYLRTELTGTTPNSPHLEIAGQYPFLRLHQPNVSFAGIALRTGSGLKITAGHDTSILMPLSVAWPEQGNDAATASYVQSLIGAIPVLPPESNAQTSTSYGIGAQANNTGYGNTAVGQNAQPNGIGQSNEAFGAASQLSLTSGEFNSAIGSYTQGAMTSGSYNMAMGRSAQYSLSTGSYNVGIGFGAQQTPGGISANATTTRHAQVAIGAETGQYAPGSGDNGVAIGYRARYHTGAVAIGGNAEARGNYSVAIGHGAVAEYDNDFVLGNIYGIVKVPGALSVAGVPMNPWVEMTQAAYDALVTKDPKILYVIKG